MPFERGDFWSGVTTASVFGGAVVYLFSAEDVATGVFDIGDYAICGGDARRGRELGVEKFGRADGDGFLSFVGAGI